MSSVTHSETDAPAPAQQVEVAAEEGVDAREQLVNGGETGPITRVSVPIHMITKLIGILLDFDPELYDPKKLPPGATESPANLHELLVGPMLSRHPVYAKAEVRDSGRGLHAILWFDTPVVFQTEAERERWAAVVRVVQKALPTDPACEGITKMTRPVGSTNSRTGRKVSVLKEGVPVTAEEVLGLVAEVQAKPFKVVAGILLDPAAPSCPVCAKPEARLGVMDRRGVCYAGKHKPTVGDLFNTVFAPRPAAKGV